MSLLHRWPKKEECSRCGGPLTGPFRMAYQCEHSPRCRRHVYYCNQCIEEIGSVHNVRCLKHRPANQ